MRGNWKAERVRKGLTLADEAELLGVSKNTVSRWETGESIPRGDALSAACDLFGVPASYLLEDTEERVA